MPKKGKAKGGRRGGATTGAERRAGVRQRARENIAMKEIAESSECFRDGRQFALDVPRLRVCGLCRESYYCDVECQRADWEDHRPRCRKVRKMNRRTCDICGLEADENDPPLPTCDCGVWRYCGEECQAQHWAAGHAEECASGYLYLEGS